MKYQLNETAAREADEHRERITEIGKYVGIFTHAEDLTSAKGTRGIDMEFETADKRTARLTLWTLNNRGEEIFGSKLLHSLMTCLHVKAIQPEPVKVMKWDDTVRQRLATDVQAYPALMHKPIGMLVETEEYEKKDGSIGVKVVPVMFFDAQTERTSSEILDKKVQPEKLANRVLTLKHRPLQRARSAAPSASTPEAPNHAFDNENDIPF